ncbi:hypothetical protein ACFY5D_21880 [Paeniglutamicibacter sp. NPDC012692]|uniref:hypothetical protein n=1 Tax=Paeniglutamicibacter sp. NPDC012692 TaxID=3364388 RepID=UPI0036A96898
MVTIVVLRFTGRIPVDAFEKRTMTLDSSQLAWTITIFVVVLIILGLLLFLGRRWKLTKDRERAESLRQSAAADELRARENEAAAARAEAEAKQAEVDAEHLREAARNQADEAEAARSRAQEQTMKAESLDPDVEAETSGRQRTDATGAPEDQLGDPGQPGRGRMSPEERDPRDGGAAGN